MSPHRFTSAALATFCVVMLAAIPVLFRQPPSTISSRGRLLELTVAVSAADPMRENWSQAALDSAANAFHSGLRLPPRPSERLAVGAHSLYPYRFLTVRGSRTLTVALSPPWPPRPARQRMPSGTLLDGPVRSGGCLVYTLQSPDE